MSISPVVRAQAQAPPQPSPTTPVKAAPPVVGTPQTPVPPVQGQIPPGFQWALVPVPVPAAPQPPVVAQPPPTVAMPPPVYAAPPVYGMPFPSTPPAAYGATLVTATGPTSTIVMGPGFFGAVSTHLGQKMVAWGSKTHIWTHTIQRTTPVVNPVVGPTSYVATTTYATPQPVQQTTVQYYQPPPVQQTNYVAMPPPTYAIPPPVSYRPPSEDAGPPPVTPTPQASKVKNFFAR